MSKGKIIVVEGDNGNVKPYLEYVVEKLEKNHDHVAYIPFPQVKYDDYGEVIPDVTHKRENDEKVANTLISKGISVIINEGHVISTIRDIIKRAPDLAHKDYYDLKEIKKSGRKITDEDLKRYLANRKKYTENLIAYQKMDKISGTTLAREYEIKFMKERGSEVERRIREGISSFLEESYSTHKAGKKLYVPSKKIYLITNHEERGLLSKIKFALEKSEIEHPGFEEIECQKQEYRGGNYGVYLEHRLRPKEEICKELYEKIVTVISNKQNRVKETQEKSAVSF